MEYKDDDGNILYGFSQISLDKNTEQIKAQTKILKDYYYLASYVLSGILVFICFVLYWLMKNDVMTNWVKILGGC